MAVLFCIGSGSCFGKGILYVQWGNYITPSQLGLVAAAQPVIWLQLEDVQVYWLYPYLPLE